MDGPSGREGGGLPAGRAVTPPPWPPHGSSELGGGSGGVICYCFEQVAHVLIQKQDLFLRTQCTSQGLGFPGRCAWLPRVRYCVLGFSRRGAGGGDRDRDGGPLKTPLPKSLVRQPELLQALPGSQVLMWTLGVPAGTPTLASRMKLPTQVPRPRSPVP